MLVTTEGWFNAPDGDRYTGVFGRFGGVFSSEETLGIKTNARSTNWYAVIGNVIVAGCQIHYVVRTDSFEPGGQQVRNHELIYE